MLLRRRQKKGPIGLDVGASGVRMLQLGSDAGQPAVAASAFCEFPRNLPDSVDMQELIARTISDALRRNPFEGREVVTCFGNGEFQLKNIRLPRMPADELAGAVEFEAKERFDLSRSPAQVRYLPVGEVRHGNELKEEVIVFAALEEAVNSRIAILESLKLEPIAIDLSPCAVARGFVRFLRRAEDVNAINVFIDLGYRGTNVIITRGAEISFIKQIEVGGIQLNEAVAKALSITPPEAAELRVRIMRENGGRRADDQGEVPPEVKAAVVDAERPFVERMSRDFQLCLRYFAVTFRGQKPETLTLVGGEAYEPLYAKILAESVSVPCTIGFPLRGMGRLHNVAGRDRRTTQPAWATACGLALRGSPWVKTGARMGERAAAPTKQERRATVGVS